MLGQFPISSAENAKTSAWLRRILIKFTLTSSARSAPILTILSGLSCSRLVSSVSPSGLGIGKSAGLLYNFFMDRSLLALFSALRRFLSEGGVSVGLL